MGERHGWLAGGGLVEDSGELGEGSRWERKGDVLGELER